MVINTEKTKSGMLFIMETFGENGCPVRFRSNFLGNLENLLGNCSKIKSFLVNGVQVSLISLYSKAHGAEVPLYIVEEKVHKEIKNPFCEYCTENGWGSHLISKSRFHFVIPEDKKWFQVEGMSLLDKGSHLLHGLIHSNGFGHLLTLNGIEGGSLILNGREIMDLWDRLCSSLGVREITVRDMSKKRSIATRLLYGIAFGKSWFGKWGFTVCSGRFGATLKYLEASKIVLGFHKLDDLVKDFGYSQNHCRKIKKTVDFYRDLSGGIELITIRDLLSFLLSVKLRTQQMHLKDHNLDKVSVAGEHKEDLDPTVDVYHDLNYLLYDVLYNHPVDELQSATRALIQSQNFHKVWPVKDDTDHGVQCLKCNILPTAEGPETMLTRPLGPEVLLVLPQNATIHELKLLAGATFRDTYYIMHKVCVTEVEGFDDNDDNEVISEHFKPGAHVWVRGSRMELTCKLKYEDEAENWTVDCRRCGAKDDDGKAMVACDTCGVWQHIYCVGIKEETAMLQEFVCKRCKLLKSCL